MVTIDPTYGNKPLKSTKRKESAKKSSGFFKQVHSSQESSETQATQPIFATQAMVMLQEIDDITIATDRSEKLLSCLEKLHLDLVNGALDTNNLQDLANIAQSKQESCHDPKLQDILSRIEQRAHIELAKLNMLQQRK